MRSSERHQLKQDQFATATRDTLDWSVEHRNTLVFAGLAIVVVLALLIGGFYWQQGRSQKASQALGEALKLYTAPVVPAGTPIPPNAVGYYSAKDRATAASGRFVDVAKNYGHTDSGTMANYFLGLCAEDMGDNAKAEEYFKKVSDAGNTDISSLAKSALAALYHDTGRDKQAIDLYKGLIEKPTNTVPKPQSQLALADIYAVQDQAQAKALYMELSKDNAENQIGQIANTRMAALK